jgi:hypothetical protein
VEFAQDKSAEECANNQHGGRKDNTIFLTNGQLTISTTSGEAHMAGNIT